MPALVGAELRRSGNNGDGGTAGDGWRNDADASLGVHAGLLATMRAATGFDRLHGQRFLLWAKASEGFTELRLGLPRDAWVEPVLDALEHLGEAGAPFRAGGVEVAVGAVGPVWGAPATYLAEGPSLRSLELAFTTPTTFAAKGRHHRAVPDPKAMVSSWARAWNALAAPAGEDPAEQEPMPAELIELLGLTLAPIDGDLRWERMRVGGPAKRSGSGRRAPPSLVGFRGDLKLELLPGERFEERARWLGCLARLVPFVGTGYRAQKGLGATEVTGERSM